MGVEISVVGNTIGSGIYRLRFGNTLAEIPLEVLSTTYLESLESLFR
jgi:hypothetical protein